MRWSSLLLCLCCRAPSSGDVDRDKFFPPNDCDDEDAAIFPGAPEACNLVDDDCDGEVDEGCPPTNLEDSGDSGNSGL